MQRPIQIVRWVIFKLKLLQIFSWAFFLLPYNSLDFEIILSVEVLNAWLLLQLDSLSKVASEFTNKYPAVLYILRCVEGGWI
jgi:hypothetical protein